MPQLVRHGQALTDRERLVLMHVARGCTDARTAREVGVSVETVKREVFSLRCKLGAANRPHAVSIGFARGYLRVTPPGDGGGR